MQTQAALTQELALIQGPPGTGKTYVGIHIIRLLLANTDPVSSTRPAASQSRPSAKLVVGPILCVCYTNHALDQFLEGLMDAGIEKIVRVGSRCAPLCWRCFCAVSTRNQARIPCQIRPQIACVDQSQLDSWECRCAMVQKRPLCMLRRSKSERLEACNLRTLCHGRASPTQRHLLYSSKEECEGMEKEIGWHMDNLLALPR